MVEKISQASSVEPDHSRSPDSNQLGSLILAGVLSTILIVGADCSLELNPAQAETVKQGDRSSDTPIPTDLEFSDSLNSASVNSNPVLEHLELASTTRLELSPTLQTGEPPIAMDATTLEFSQSQVSVRVPVPQDIFSTDRQLQIEEGPSIAVRSIETSLDGSSVPSQIADSQIAAPAIDRMDASALSEAEWFQPVLEPPEPLQFVSDLPDADAAERSSSELGAPLVHVQAAYVLQDSESSGRLRVTGAYAVTPNLLFGATVDLTAGENFANSAADGVNFDLNELYFTLSPTSLPNLRFTAGMIDLTSYFDRNSFAKDSLTQFFNPVFQTNPALAATGIGSRPGALVNWDVTDHLNVKAAAFSSSRDLGDFAVDGFAGEVGLRLGNLIVRGTYANDRDAGQQNGFQEIFQISRGNNEFGFRSGDREESLGINAEFFIPELNLGLFGRYGHYENLAIDRGGSTYSFGLNLLDVFTPDDRLGLAYGQQLSNDSLRQESGNNIPDVVELFYDFRLSPNLRAGVTVQERDGFSDTVLGIRVRADFDIK
ncbi:MAG: carbohydrate porin [Leptolyngbyaceae cyanobacterium CRU_2_3]|nr:carbohydrate porin [Leptolyngbyaceae cyanobacterium CRU_2_3]